MKKSLLVSALLNMLIPGFCNLYLGNGWKRTITGFFTGVVLWVLCFLLVRAWNAPFLYLLIPVIFFVDGLTVAKHYNRSLGNNT